MWGFSLDIPFKKGRLLLFGGGQGSFVAAFAQSNAGDVSPDTGEPKCVDSGLPCTLSYSNCVCVSSGPGRDEIQSTKIIGGLQFKKALVENCSFEKKT